MNKILDDIVYKSIQVMINETISDKTFKKIKNKHQNKMHFIPIKYRVFGGMLQSLNIKFGNFIEEAMRQILLKNDNIEIIDKYSGKRSNKFCITQKSEQLIDNYITNCEINTFSEEQIQINYINLIKQLMINEANEKLKTINFHHDVDILFKDKKTDIIYYAEIKYNDDHDTGKFVDINRKLLKTYAYLIRELKIYDMQKFKPILFYFTNKRMKGNIYIPENIAIYRGKRFFDTFTTLKYDELEKYMLSISESENTIKQFDNIYNKVVQNKTYSYNSNVTIYSVKEEQENYNIKQENK